MIGDLVDVKQVSSTTGATMATAAGGIAPIAVIAATTIRFRAAGAPADGTKWESDGQGTYAIESVEKPTRGKIRTAGRVDLIEGPAGPALGLVTGVLAFIPNIGAITSGLLMVAVGFSAGTHEGAYAIFVYFFVQNIDGYLVLPYIARKTVDLAPAIVLAMQLLMGALFGILGGLFADPILASLKVVLVDISNRHGAREGEPPEAADG